MLNERQKIKLNCGAERHHYSMFNVGRSMFDVQYIRCWNLISQNNLEPLNGHNLPFLKIATRSHIPMIAAARNPIIPMRDMS